MTRGRIGAATGCANDGRPGRARLRAPRLLGIAACLTLIASCELDTTSSRFGGHAEVAGAALVLESGERLTPPFVLPAGGPHLIRVEFLDENNRPIQNLDQSDRSGIFFHPSGRTLTETVREPRAHQVIFTDGCNPPTRVSIGYGHDQRVDERRFGPFPLEVEGGLGSARLLAADSTELTPQVEFVSGQPTEVFVEIFGCDGELITGLEEEHEVILFWLPTDFATWERVDEAGFRNVVTAHAAPGRSGHMSIGVRQVGATWHQTFGPFRVTAVDEPEPEPQPEPEPEPDPDPEPVPEPIPDPEEG